jgi:hypothetical protein
MAAVAAVPTVPTVTTVPKEAEVRGAFPSGQSSEQNNAVHDLVSSFVPLGPGDWDDFSLASASTTSGKWASSGSPGKMVKPG